MPVSRTHPAEPSWVPKQTYLDASLFLVAMQPSHKCPPPQHQHGPSPLLYANFCGKEHSLLASSSVEKTTASSTMTW